MAGQPLRRQLMGELERRTRLTFEDEPEATHLDYVEDWQARGQTLNQLAVDCGLGPDNGEFISRYLKRTFPSADVVDRLSQARARGAHRLVDKAIATADSATVADVNVARLQVQTYQWTAEKWNARELGAAKNAAGVTINVNHLHMDALVKNQLAPPALAAIESAIDVEHEIVSAEIIST